jgi:hypothetical protein
VANRGGRLPLPNVVLCDKITVPGQTALGQAVLEQTLAFGRHGSRLGQRRVLGIAPLGIQHLRSSRIHTPTATHGTTFDELQ